METKEKITKKDIGTQELLFCGVVFFFSFIFGTIFFNEDVGFVGGGVYCLLYLFL